MKKNLFFTSLKILCLSSFLSCQKQRIARYGHLSHFQSPARKIASVSTQKSHVDSKQILIFCMVKSKDPKECYYDKAKMFQLNTLNNGYNKVSRELNYATQSYFKNISPKLSKIISKRVDFCDKNNLYNFKRCLKLSSRKSAMTILNQEHKEHHFNAQEYLYLKDKIQNYINDENQKNILARLSK